MKKAKSSGRVYIQPRIENGGHKGKTLTLLPYVLIKGKADRRLTAGQTAFKRKEQKMKIIKMFKAKMQLAKKKHNEELRRKYYEIRGELIKFYEDKDITEGNPINLPAFVRADNTLKQFVKNANDINFYYGKLLKYRRVSA